jgi:catechol 2,3-dioxygenase-like lactoylglutathione lyase family enzyme
MNINNIDHVQLAMPAGEEAKARVFYAGVLGMNEIPKPPILAKRGGAWFQTGSVQLHLGVEEDFRPAKKAHVALTVSGAAELRRRLAIAGYPVREDAAIDGVKRFFTDDAFGNRIEFIDVEGSVG